MRNARKMKMCNGSVVVYTILVESETDSDTLNIDYYVVVDQRCTRALICVRVCVAAFIVFSLQYLSHAIWCNINLPTNLLALSVCVFSPNDLIAQNIFHHSIVVVVVVGDLMHQ